ncbi:heme oxygenase-like protein [Lentinula aff. lateritia]|uniref:Heme oxygenase-like protein n=1 Tax=Lentinula aff. lateritia TaxID=2804960 RepID=A0ACC1U3X1_9AGAR|nr:heme oxygenase-like protein [Lentinula aff. lateritia]
MSPSLTKYLTSSFTAAYTSAIKHSFLTAAGSGTLDHNLLALWLAQDRIYAAHAYPKFIGSLISNIPFNSKDSHNSSQELLNQRIFKLLLFSLQNVDREVGFFQETAQKWCLNQEGWPERKGTRNYTAEMSRISNHGTVIDGLIFLWAMERVYLDAWTYVRDLTNTSVPFILSSESTPTPTNSAILSLSDNWSCPEFVKFVDDLADLVDSLGIQPGSAEWSRAKEVWARVIELEADFWPIEEEARLAK